MMSNGNDDLLDKINSRLGDMDEIHSVVDRGIEVAEMGYDEGNRYRRFLVLAEVDSWYDEGDVSDSEELMDYVFDVVEESMESFKAVVDWVNDTIFSLDVDKVIDEYDEISDEEDLKQLLFMYAMKHVLSDEE